MYCPTSPWVRLISSFAAAALLAFATASTAAPAGPLAPPSRGAALQDAGMTCRDGWASRLSAVASFKVWAVCEGDYAGAIHAALPVVESVWKPMTGLMGPPKPDGGGSERGGDDTIDVYLVRPRTQTQGGQSVTREGQSRQLGAANALTVASPPEGFPDGTASGFILIDRDALLSTDAGRRARLRSNFVHEFFHVLQHRYAYKPTRGPEGGAHWFVEATATWAEWEFARESAASQVHSRFTLDFQPSTLPLNATGTHSYGAYIWPFFMQMEQEGGPASIAKAWKAIEQKRNYGEIDDAIDSQFSFAKNYHRFALRNLNLELDGVIGRRYAQFAAANGDSSFPDNVPPVGARDRDTEHVGPVDDGESLAVPVTLLPLSAAYRRYQFSDDIGQLLINASGVTHENVVGATVIFKDRKSKKWSLRHLTGRNGDVQICNPEEMYFVLSNRSRATHHEVTGSATLKPLKKACKGWSGNMNQTTIIDTSSEKNISIDGRVLSTDFRVQRSEYLTNVIVNEGEAVAEGDIHEYISWGHRSTNGECIRSLRMNFYGSGNIIFNVLEEPAGDRVKYTILAYNERVEDTLVGEGESDGEEDCLGRTTRVTKDISSSNPHWWRCQTPEGVLDPDAPNVLAGSQSWQSPIYDSGHVVMGMDETTCTWDLTRASAPGEPDGRRQGPAGPIGRS
jgi:hypothetical protein